MEIVNIKKLTPMGSKILTTCDRYEEEVEKDGIIDTEKSEGAVKEFQTVIAVGPYCRNVKVGDLVQINPARYVVKRYKDGSLKDNAIKQNEVIGFNFPLIEVDNKICMLLFEEDVDFIVNEFETVEVHNSEIIE